MGVMIMNRDTKLIQLTLGYHQYEKAVKVPVYLCGGCK